MRRRLGLSSQDLIHLTDETIEAFWAQVKSRSRERDDYGREPCWEWLGSEAQGRGLYSFKVKGEWVVIAAHHVAYYLRMGRIGEGLRFLRLCTPGTIKGNPRSVPICVNPVHWSPKGVPTDSNGRRPPSSSSEMTLFTQGDLRNIRVTAERTSMARDTANAEDHQLTPAETHLIVLAEKILATLPEDRMGNYKIVVPPILPKPTKTLPILS